MPTVEKRPAGPLGALAGPSRLPVVALASVLMLIAAGWLFFLATFELSKVNYERHGGARAYKAAPAQQRNARPVVTLSTMTSVAGAGRLCHNCAVKVWLQVALATFLASASYAQGQIAQVLFANKVGKAVDSPVTLTGTNPILGPGPGWTAQLFLEETDGSLTPLTPTSTFRPPGAGAAYIADRYWIPKIVDVPGINPGEQAIFVVRVWLTSAGSFEAALPSGFIGGSSPFTVFVGGGLLPPGLMTTLQAFPAIAIPEPSALALSVLGSSALLLLRQRR
jgi:hypothetical protein